MKKLLVFIIFMLFVFYFYNYISYSYENTYNIKAYEIKEKYDKSRYYFEIKVDNHVYNFDIYGNKKIKRNIINDIEYVNANGYTCVYPKIKNVLTYPLCSLNGNNISYDLIDEITINSFIEKLNIKFKTEKQSLEKLYYYDNLDKNTVVALYTYNGYYIMNSSSIEFVKIFDNEKYDNSLSYQFNKYLIMPNYDTKFEYNTFYMLNVLTREVIEINTKYTISNDFYYTGYNKSNVYIFDNKYNVLYELNVIKKTISAVGNEEMGYIKYQNNQKLTARLNDYKINKIVYNSENKTNCEYSLYNGVYKTYIDNKNIKTKILDTKGISIIKKHENKLYYIKEDKFYEYNSLNGNKLIFNYYELNFNKQNNIFVFNK